MARMERPRLVGLATVAELVRLERSARRPPDEVRGDQLTRLGRAVVDARRAPFWAAQLADVATPRSLDDLATVAVIDKQALREIDERDRLTAPLPPGTRTLNTTGTTGVAMPVHYSPRAAWWQGVLRLRSSRARGLPLWGPAVALTLRPDRRRQRGVAAAVQRSRQVALSIDAEGSELAAVVPHMGRATLSGHPHLLVELGEALDGRVRPRAVLTYGETLTPEVRASLRLVFAADPLDAYGTAECGLVAWQCGAADLYHVNHEAVVVEIVDDEERPCPPGVTGRLLLTSLWNPLMPFVRYAIGDSAAWATRPCRCGSMLPALTALAGRTLTWIVDARGTRVAPQRLWASLYLSPEGLEGIRRYQVRQGPDRRIDVEVVADPTFTEAHAAQWAASYRRLLGDLPIEVRCVERIETSPHEKFEIISSTAAPG